MAPELADSGVPAKLDALVPGIARDLLLTEDVVDPRAWACEGSGGAAMPCALWTGMGDRWSRFEGFGEPAVEEAPGVVGLDDVDGLFPMAAVEEGRFELRGEGLSCMPCWCRYKTFVGLLSCQAAR